MPQMVSSYLNTVNMYFFYLELKSGCVSLTSVCGQEEVPIRLLKKKIQAS